MRKSACRGIRLGMLLDDRAVDGAQLGARRVEVGARREPAEQLGHPMHAAVHHRRVQMVRAGHDVGDDLGFRRIGHRRLERRRRWWPSDRRAGRSCR